jgi:hypothetical protein
MRVAVCIAGHFRNYKNVKESFLNNFLSPLRKSHNVDVFISTWLDAETSQSPHVRVENDQNFSQLVGKPIDFLDICQSYQPKSIQVNDYGKIKEVFNYGRLVSKPLNFGQFPIQYYIMDGTLLTASQLYNIWSANELKYKEEIAGNFTYDIVVRCRPDFGFNAPVELVQDDKIYVPNIWKEEPMGEYALDDRFAFGNSLNMDTYANSYLELKKNLEEWTPERYPYNEDRCNCQHIQTERVLYRHLRKYGIEYSAIKVELFR